MASHTLFTALSGAQKYPDFGPTGYIRDVVTSQEDCYSHITKPDCDQLNCPTSFALPQCKNIITCRDATQEEYAAAAFQFNTAMPQHPSPCVVVMAENPTCIQAVVMKVRELQNTTHQNIRLAVRGNRHSYIGASTADAGVVVDISQFKTLTVNPDGRTVVVGAGNTLGQLYNTLSMEHQLLYPGGTCPGVGISGLTLGGGKGILLRKHGLSTDQVLEVKMVNADAKTMTINENSFPDLYWALRGGGNGNYGIVYEFTLAAYEIPAVNKDLLYYFHNSSDWPTMIEKWQECLQTPAFQKHQNVWSRLTITPTELIIAFHISGTTDSSLKCIDELAKVPGTSVSGYYEDQTFTQCTYTPENYTGSLAFWAACTLENRCGTVSDFQQCLQNPTCGQPFAMTSGYQNPGYLSPDGIRSAIHYMLTVKEKTGCENASMQMDSLGGAINAIASEATAFPHRNSTLAYQFLSYYVQPCDQPSMTEWFNDFIDNITTYLGVGKYRNYANLNIRDHNQQYFQENYQRLVNIKAVHDPDNFFEYSQSIPTTISESRMVLYAAGGASVLAFSAFVIYCFASKFSQQGQHAHSD